MRIVMVFFLATAAFAAQQPRHPDHPDTPKTRLAPGDYWMMLMASEQRWFGPVGVGRTSRSDGPFHVVP